METDRRTHAALSSSVLDGNHGFGPSGQEKGEQEQEEEDEADTSLLMRPAPRPMSIPRRSVALLPFLRCVRN